MFTSLQGPRHSSACPSRLRVVVPPALSSIHVRQPRHRLKYAHRPLSTDYLPPAIRLNPAGVVSSQRPSSSRFEELSEQYIIFIKAMMVRLIRFCLQSIRSLTDFNSKDLNCKASGNGARLRVAPGWMFARILDLFVCNMGYMRRSARLGHCSLFRG